MHVRMLQSVVLQRAPSSYVHGACSQSIIRLSDGLHVLHRHSLADTLDTWRQLLAALNQTDSAVQFRHVLRADIAVHLGKYSSLRANFRAVPAGLLLPVHQTAAEASAGASASAECGRMAENLKLQASRLFASLRFKLKS